MLNVDHDEHIWMTDLENFRFCELPLIRKK